jgi:polyhydroxyalkanoate synthesis repressor PhaR
MPKTLKRYANRKLYDVADKEYVTLARVAELVAEGEDVRVVDNATGDDVTGVVLSQALSARERRKRGFLPRRLLQRVLRDGARMKEAILERAGGRLETALKALRVSTTSQVEVLESRLAALEARLAALERRRA